MKNSILALWLDFKTLIITVLIKLNEVKIQLIPGTSTGDA